MACFGLVQHSELVTFFFFMLGLMHFWGISSYRAMDILSFLKFLIPDQYSYFLLLCLSGSDSIGTTVSLCLIRFLCLSSKFQHPIWYALIFLCFILSVCCFAFFIDFIYLWKLENIKAVSHLLLILQIVCSGSESSCGVNRCPAKAAISSMLVFSFTGFLCCSVYFIIVLTSSFFFVWSSVIHPARCARII